MKNKNLEKRITLRYASALFIIAILSTSSFYTLYKFLEESSSTAYIVNISGKQRMLGQHIALDVHRVYHSLQNHKNSIYKTDLVIENLLTHIKEMKETNKILSTGELPNGDNIILSPKIHAIYFNELNLKKRVDEYVELSNRLSKFKELEQIDTIVYEIDSKSEQLLMDLDKAVKQYEFEGSQKLQELQNLEILAWILVIFTLLLEVIFIFQPIVKKIVSLMDENDNVLNSLEKEVELRTLKLREANHTLKEIASKDPMTGLNNRLTLEDDIEKAIQHFEEHKAPFSLLSFDIDWFKKVNDKYGHDIGDIVIKDVSHILQKSVREEDKVYRAGGEEFVLLLNRVSLEDTHKIAEKIRLLIERKVFKVDTEEFSKTISGGLYHTSISNAKSIAHVLKIVDNALYKSKKEGRNRVTEVS
ncbi:diguanylate cyclase (GGDEF domain) [hydrothermal vent metagenome]|uniref:Diguanylate cyclase (GGDEF domain) n=1 Tax=hydrothermal vent metagenome TaxID=652676 RepID=A0A1W1BP18_9ZZZZ